MSSNIRDLRNAALYLVGLVVVGGAIMFGAASMAERVAASSASIAAAFAGEDRMNQRA